MYGFNVFQEAPRSFIATYQCYSIALLPGNERADVENGGKIILPPTALETLSRLNISFPMLFKLTNKKLSRSTHCGVLEFIADEGNVYLPLWMMSNLYLEESEAVQIESVSRLPIGTFAKFQPLTPDFLDISNPKAVLENCLRTFACLTTGDVIAVKYNEKAYELCVLETKPESAISIIECDMSVDFAPPIGYKEPQTSKKEDDSPMDISQLIPKSLDFVAFRGTGNRLDGKRRKDSYTPDTIQPKVQYVRGIPNYDYVPDNLKFIRNVNKPETKKNNDDFMPFGGSGYVVN